MQAQGHATPESLCWLTLLSGCRSTPSGMQTRALQPVPPPRGNPPPPGPPLHQGLRITPQLSKALRPRALLFPQQSPHIALRYPQGNPLPRCQDPSPQERLSGPTGPPGSRAIMRHPSTIPWRMAVHTSATLTGAFLDQHHSWPLGPGCEIPAAVGHATRVLPRCRTACHSCPDLHCEIWHSCMQPVGGRLVSAWTWDWEAAKAFMLPAGQNHLASD